MAVLTYSEIPLPPDCAFRTFERADLWKQSKYRARGSFVQIDLARLFVVANRFGDILGMVSHSSISIERSHERDSNLWGLIDA